MDDMNCRGTENDISTCQFNGWGNNDCGHDQDVGVECRMYIKVFSKDYNVNVNLHPLLLMLDFLIDNIRMYLFHLVGRHLCRLLVIYSV